MCGLLFVMYGSMVFCSVFAITDRSEMGLYDVPMGMSCLVLVLGLELCLIVSMYEGLCCFVMCCTCQ